jgi:phenylacetate-coenzyme A ligase PaaK-like adenylate-forming protein
LSTYQELIARQRADQSDEFLLSVRRIGWSAQRLAAEREGRLRELLAWSFEHSDFWRERLAGIDLSTFTEADLSRLPILTKKELMGNFDRLVTNPNLTLERVNEHVNRHDEDAYLDDEYRVVVTSGTGGTRGLFVYGWNEWITFSLIATRWRSRSSLPQTRSTFRAHFTLFRATSRGRVLCGSLTCPRHCRFPISSRV